MRRTRPSCTPFFFFILNFSPLPLFWDCIRGKIREALSLSLSMCVMSLTKALSLLLVLPLSVQQKKDLNPPSSHRFLSCSLSLVAENKKKRESKQQLSLWLSSFVSLPFSVLYLCCVCVRKHEKKKGR
jgi:hypothetical protein